MQRTRTNFFLHHINPIYKYLCLLLIGSIVFFALSKDIDLLGRLMIGWDAFSLISVILYIIIFNKTTIAQIRAKAKDEDSSNLIVFAIVIIATLASLLAVIILVTSKDRNNKSVHDISAILGMVFSWLLVHSLFTIRYAHLYYADDDQDKTTHAEGLDFPDDNAPDFRDFAYFAFVIGMTFQVSDIEISSKEIRRLVLLHSLLSFAFNTVIVALTINVVAGLGNS